MELQLTSEQKAFQQAAQHFAREHVAGAAASIDQTNRFPHELVALAGGFGLTGIPVPKKWGGAGKDHVSYVIAIEEIARASATLAVALALNTSLVVEPIERFGSDRQKERWLKRMASGSSVGAFALSEEQAGTDVANIETIALRQQGGGYRLQGRKVWVACGQTAEIAIVFAATDPERRRETVTAFLVPLDETGVERVRTDETLGVRGLGCVDLAFQGTPVAKEQVLGAEGDGLRVASYALAGGRISVAAQAIGVGQAALDEALAHAKKRRTFGRAIAEHQAVQFMLADMATELEAARMLTLKAAAACDEGEPPAAEASMAKLYASEAAYRATDRAMQIFASAGYRKGSVVERLFRDIRGAEIYQGTSEAQRMVIAEEILR